MPNEGNGYAGLILIEGSDIDYKEYLQVKLSDSLVKDELYTLALNLSLAENSSFSVDELGVYASVEEIKKVSSNTLHLTPYALFWSPEVMSNTKHWQKITLQFKAKGNEKYLLIGNFNTDRNTKGKRLKKLENPYEEYAYYYVDNVSCISHNTIMLPAAEPASEKVDQFVTSFILKDVYFNNDEALLLLRSVVELNNLVRTMNEHPQIVIEVLGHTDDNGDSLYNIGLSQSRAEAVAQYLINAGILPHRINSQGYGENQPLVPNTNSVNRAINRRVEVRLLHL